VFSELGDLLEPRRSGISPELLAAIQCMSRWRKAGFGSDNMVDVSLTDEQLIAQYNMEKWKIGQAVDEELNTTFPIQIS
jgi:hypothetical protein